MRGFGENSEPLWLFSVPPKAKNFPCSCARSHSNTKASAFFVPAYFRRLNRILCHSVLHIGGKKCNTIIVIKKKWLQCFYLTDIHSVMPLKYGIQPNIFGGKSLELNETFWRKKNGTTKMWENITEGWKKQKCS